MGSIWKLGCCGKIFPSKSLDTPSVTPAWSSDLAGQGGVGGVHCFKGLCRAALDTGVGRGPHELPTGYADFLTWGTWDERQAYAQSLPSARAVSAEELLRLRTRYAVEDVGWTSQRAWDTVAKSEQPAFDVGGYGAFGGVLDGFFGATTERL